MTISTASAARTIGGLTNWRVSNLELQKLLYLAHMYHLGRTDGEPLIYAPFEAWDLGPVVADLYYQAKIFGSGPVRDIFFGSGNAPEDSEEYRSIKETVDALAHKTPAELVALTHWKDGAWRKCYIPGIDGIQIPDDEILREYRERTRKAA